MTDGGRDHEKPAQDQAGDQVVAPALSVTIDGEWRPLRPLRRPAQIAHASAAGLHRRIHHMEKFLNFYDFDEINQAIHDSESGKTIKPIVRMQ